MDFTANHLFDYSFFTVSLQNSFDLFRSYAINLLNKLFLSGIESVCKQNLTYSIDCYCYGVGL